MSVWRWGNPGFLKNKFTSLMGELTYHHLKDTCAGVWDRFTLLDPFSAVVTDNVRDSRRFSVVFVAFIYHGIAEWWRERPIAIFKIHLQLKVNSFRYAVYFMIIMFYDHLSLMILSKNLWHQNGCLHWIQLVLTNLLSVSY